MPQRTVAFVVGTRAQLIKVAPVIAACQTQAMHPRLLLTGQHAETIDDLLAEFGVDVAVERAVAPKERATVVSLLRWMPRAVSGIGAALRRYSQAGPLDVVVHGDTLSAVLGAWAGRHCGARVVHLESGLTSGRWYDPFPEELSRRLVFRWTDVALCPSAETAQFMRTRYRCEAVDTGGNTIVDAVRLAGVEPGAASASYLVVSLHRFQNLFSRARFDALMALVTDLSRTLPVHFVLHPATRKRLAASGRLQALEREPGLSLSPRLGYSAFLRLASGAACVLTDGGSNQEELAALGVPTIVMRPRTERPDGLGANALMEADVPGGVLEFVRSGGSDKLRRDPELRDEPGPSARIAAYLAGQR